MTQQQWLAGLTNKPRKRWLTDLANKLRPLFQAADHPLPPFILATGDIDDIDGLSTSHLKGGTWHITLSDAINDKIQAAENLISILTSIADDTSQRQLATLIGYGRTRPDGDKLTWGIRRLVGAMPPYPPQMTRKSWLTALVDELRPLFVEADRPLPMEIEASPGRMHPEHPRNGVLKYTSGECHIFIWPRLSSAIDAALALVRQLPRCATDVFTSEHTMDEVAHQIGITNGRPPSLTLKFLLNNIIADLGPYPEK